MKCSVGDRIRVSLTVDRWYVAKDDALGKKKLASNASSSSREIPLHFHFYDSQS